MARHDGPNSPPIVDYPGLACPSIPRRSSSRCRPGIRQTLTHLTVQVILSPASLVIDRRLTVSFSPLLFPLVLTPLRPNHPRPLPPRDSSWCTAQPKRLKFVRR
jgi:hypothetical protein